MILSSLALLTLAQAPPKLAPLKPVPGTSGGRCVTMAGKPLAGVKIYIGGTTQASAPTSYEVTSNAAGRYSLRLPAGNFHVGRANWSVPAPKGVPYWLPLQPFDRNDDDAPSTKGIVEDLVLRPSGMTRPNADPTSWVSYYGGSIVIEEGHVEKANWLDRDRWTWPRDGSKVELTLTPTTALIDGAPAKVVTKSAETEGASGYVFDVPIAAYTVAATLVAPDGTRKPLRVATPQFFSGYAPSRKGEPEPKDFRPSAELWFPANGTDSTPVLRGTGVARTTVYVIE